MDNLISQSHIPITISVVIPTLGGQSLQGTIKNLNKGSLVPDEILVCIPKEFSQRIEVKESSNVRIIATDCRGQVAQRVEGFKQAAGKYVLQLDDDILVDQMCLERMASFLESKSGKYSISPAFRFLETNKTVYPKPSVSILYRLYYLLINGSNGYKPGTITKAGTEIGIDPTLSNEKYIEVEWLPGGCVLHARENLVLYNFYPMKGKAFCEDLYHSVHLAKNGVKFYIGTQAIAWIDDPRDQSISLSSSLNDTRSDYKARRLLMKELSKNTLRMNLYYSLIILKKLGKAFSFRDGN